MSARLLYLVHDLSDPSVHRRVRMLRMGGVDDIRIAGFRRSADPVPDVDGFPAVDLGRTEHGRLTERLALVGSTLAHHGRLEHLAAGADVVLARNIEPLAIAAVVRRRYARRAPLFYECLDVHGLLAAGGAPAAVLRAVEGALLRRSDGVVVSSPAFVTEYFARVHRHHMPRALLVENRMLESEVAPEQRALLRRSEVGLGPAPRPPWRIGWLGLIRCERSLRELTTLCRALPGTVEVVVRGRPIRELAGPLADAARTVPGFRYEGPYDRERELFDIYTDLHFSWTLDWLDAASNSRWLLPNRLYEGGLFQCVPLALAGVETGRWLDRRGLGVRLAEPVGASLRIYFAGLTPDSYREEHRLVSTTPLSDYLVDADGATEFVRDLTG